MGKRVEGCLEDARAYALWCACVVRARPNYEASVGGLQHLGRASWSPSPSIRLLLPARLVCLFTCLLRLLCARVL
jgi:hypothetical protein